MEFPLWIGVHWHFACHWASARRVWFPLLLFHPACIHIYIYMLIRMMVTSLSQFCCPLLSSLQFFHASSVLRSPVLDPTFPMWAHQCLPWSVGEAFPNRPNVISNLLCWEEALFIQGQPVVRKDPGAILCKASLHLVSSQLSRAWGYSYSSTGFGVCRM